MIHLRKSSDRGRGDHGWLNSYHTFSFANYHDPDHMGFRALRVMNEDRVASGQGFGTHAHHDMEIVSYVLDGALEHKDSMGNGEILKAGEFQRISAGSGITHSEFNPSTDQPAHFYQIWLLPAVKGLEPSYEQKSFDSGLRRNRLQLVASPDAAEGSLTIQQDVRIYLADVQANKDVLFELPEQRYAWIQVLCGSVQVNSVRLEAGDGVAASDEHKLQIVGDADSEIMLFDLA